MNTNKILGLFDKYQVVIVKADGVVQDELVTSVNSSDVIGESDNEVLYVESGDEYNEYSTRFSESGLNGAIINVYGNLVMEDTEGDSIEFKFQEIKSIHLVKEDID
jgi:hypothetical protein